jgi:hypothetical protein
MTAFILFPQALTTTTSFDPFCPISMLVRALQAYILLLGRRQQHL